MENTQKPIKATLDSSDDSVKTQKPILIQLDDIPTPEVEDAGKVLGVDEEGKYALVEGGGGGGSVYPKCTVTITNNTGSIYSMQNNTLLAILDLVNTKTLGQIFIREGGSIDNSETAIFSGEYFSGELVAVSNGGNYDIAFDPTISVDQATTVWTSPIEIDGGGNTFYVLYDGFTLSFTIETK